jgi:hypothetical protein
MAQTHDVPATATLNQMFEELKNWGRWGDDDQQGALNYLTGEHTPSACGLGTGCPVNPVAVP